MHSLSRLVVVLGAATLISVASPIFAESAPVFDADSMQQQFDGDTGLNQSDSAPPASEQAFVPVQSQAKASSAGASSGMSTEQRLHHAEQQIADMQSTESTAKVESLQSQMQSLRGQVEQLSHQVQLLQSQLKSDKRVGITDDTLTPADSTSDQASTKAAAKAGAKIAATKPAAKTILPTTTTGDDPKKTLDGQPNVAEEQEIYQTAYNLIKVKKYNEAVVALQGMLKKYPSGQFASNAHYWLGELYGLMGKNDQALTEFDTVVSNYPESPRVSDAQLKVGLIYSAQSKWGDAKTTFKKVINHYPGTAPARVASEQLKQIKTAGH